MQKTYTIFPLIIALGAYLILRLEGAVLIGDWRLKSTTYLKARGMNYINLPSFFNVHFKTKWERNLNFNKVKRTKTQK